jgi:hypothetical protein
MRRVWMTLVAVGALVSMTTPVQAQDYNADVGYGGGGVYFTDLATGGAQTLKFKPGWIVNAHVEQWLGSGRLGIRLGGAMTRRPLDIGSNFSVGNIRTWMGDASVLLRFVAPSENNTVAPFIGVGVGLVSYRLGTGPRVAIGEANAVYPGNAQNQLAGLGSFGLDILPDLHWGMHGSQQIGFRLEGTDRVALKSPFQKLAGGDFGPIHQIAVTLEIFSEVDWLFH